MTKLIKYSTMDFRIKRLFQNQQSKHIIYSLHSGIFQQAYA